MIQIGTDDPERLEGSTGADTMTGLMGNDSYVVNDAGDLVVELVDGGSDTVEASITWTLTDNVENLILTGTAETAYGNGLANVLTGNASANRLWGYDGNDWLDGGLGKDKMAGGAGDDTYIVDNINDQIYEFLDNVDSGGNDTVRASLSYSLAKGVENLILTGSAVEGYGNSLVNRLTGNDLGNLLNGGAGADTLVGGKGNDTYYVDNAGDIIIEKHGEGTDTLYSSVTYTLADSAYIQKLYLTGGADLSLTGNRIDNRLYGNAGNNVLDGRAGADTMSGGDGDDTYYVDNTGDIIKEKVGGGHDVAWSSVTYTLGLKSYVQELNLTGSGHINATGNNSANTLRGNAGNNILDGLGGADKMYGGVGNDTYYIDNAGDRVYNTDDGNLDMVRVGVTYTLPNIVSGGEWYELTGTADLNLTGNAYGNRLFGNSGNNVLDGKGGADQMQGGGGNDTYYVDNAGDRLLENTSQGTDTLYASVSFSFQLDSGGSIEFAYLTGTGNLSLSGGTTTTTLYGNAGNNTLTGQGTMVGGQGNDIYYADGVNAQVVESAGGGTDTVYVNQYFRLAAGSEVETLRINPATGGTTGPWGTIFGNELSNTLIGDNRGNILNGGGGADTMSGGGGDDTYYIDNAGDQIIDTDTSGNFVYVPWSYVVREDQGNLSTWSLMDRQGDGNLTGNSSNNRLIGNDASNILNGGGGNDTLIGMEAPDSFDTYIFDLNSGQDSIIGLGENDLIDISAYTHGVDYGGGVTFSMSNLGTTINLGDGNTIFVADFVDWYVAAHIVW